MKHEARLGEDMIKKRLDQKRKDNEAKVGPTPDHAKQLLDNKNRIYKNNRLEMSDLPEGETVSVPVIMQGPTEVYKYVVWLMHLFFMIRLQPRVWI